MWSEEKIRAVLDAKKDKLKEEQIKLYDLGQYIYGSVKLDNQELLVTVGEEIREKRQQVKKIENQIEVLKYILDIE